MNSFAIDTSGNDLSLQLTGEVTIEHARALHAALEKLLTPTRGLLIDAARLTRVDAAALQILIAASRSAAAITVIARSDAWDSACQRYALAAGFPRKANPRH